MVSNAANLEIELSLGVSFPERFLSNSPSCGGGNLT